MTVQCQPRKHVTFSDKSYINTVQTMFSRNSFVKLQILYPPSYNSSSFQVTSRLRNQVTDTLVSSVSITPSGSLVEYNNISRASYYWDQSSRSVVLSPRTAYVSMYWPGSWFQITWDLSGNDFNDRVYLKALLVGFLFRREKSYSLRICFESHEVILNIVTRFNWTGSMKW